MGQALSARRIPSKDEASMRTFFFAAAFGAAALSAGNGAQAHAVWLERDGEGPARAYFGEFAEGQHEKTGAKLDGIASPLAWQGPDKRGLALVRRADHIEIAARGGADVLLTEAGLAPRADKQRGGHTKTVFHAKTGRAEPRPQLELDLVPATRSGSVFVLSFPGRSLPKARLTLVGPPGWEKPLSADEWGQVRLPALPWRGRYLVEASHVEEAPGEAAGQPYQRVRHVFTVSLDVPEGIEPPAR